MTGFPVPRHARVSDLRSIHHNPSCVVTVVAVFLLFQSNSQILAAVHGVDAVASLAETNPERFLGSGLLPGGLGVGGPGLEQWGRHLRLELVARLEIAFFGEPLRENV